MNKRGSYLKLFIGTIILLIVVFTVPIPKKVNTACLLDVSTDCKSGSIWILGEPLWKTIIHYLYPSFNGGVRGGIFCGGIAGMSCPDGYKCKYDGHYPDVGGVCVKKIFNIF